MNREQTIEAIKVMQAFVDGKTVECKFYTTGWSEMIEPAWNFQKCEYRIKPTPKLRPWTADEVPLGVWLRLKDSQEDRRLLTWAGRQSDRQTWLEEREHSTDCGKTWLPCGVEEKE